MRFEFSRPDVKRQTSGADSTRRKQDDKLNHRFFLTFGTGSDVSFHSFGLVHARPGLFESLVFVWLKCCNQVGCRFDVVHRGSCKGPKA